MWFCAFEEIKPRGFLVRVCVGRAVDLGECETSFGFDVAVDFVVDVVKQTSLRWSARLILGV